MGDHTISLDDVDEALVRSVAPDGVDTDAWLSLVVVQHVAQGHAQQKAEAVQRGAQRPEMDAMLAGQEDMPTPPVGQDPSGGGQDATEAGD